MQSMVPAEQIDLADVTLFAEGAPHDVFDRLRSERPVHWNAGGGGFWALTRHADVVEVSRDTETWSSARRGLMLFDSFEAEDARARMMIELDPPRHSRYRGLVNRGFAPRMIRRLAPVARTRVNEILDRALELRDCDFVADVAGSLPLQMIADLMGVPPADRPRVYEIANRVMAFSDPEYAQVSGGENADAMAEMRAYAAELAAEHRRQPRDDVTGVLLSADVDGDALDAEEFELFFLLLVVAGIETTRSAISAGLLAFDRNPEQWRRLQKDRGLLPSAIEEVLRFTSPIHHFRRTATRDAEIAGVPIRKEDRVVMWYAAANRDEAVFRDPHRFDIGRHPNEHLSFGFGRHFCLGASLARLELRALLEALLEREITLELRGDPGYMRSNFAQSIKRMPVSLHAATDRPG